MIAGGLQFAPLLPWPVIAVLAAIGVVLVAASALRRGKGTWLRLGFLSLLTFALLDPRVVQEEREPQTDVAVLLLDKSSSQRTGQRLEQLAAAEQALKARLAKVNGLEVRTVEVADGTVDGSSTSRGGTRLYDTLKAAVAEVPRQRFAGAVVITDGQVHDIPEEIAEDDFTAPVHTLLTGAPDESDRRLSIVSAPGYGIVGKEVTVTYRIEDRHAAKTGLTGRASAKVTARIDGTEKEVSLVPVGQDTKFTFNLDHAGPSLVEFEVEPSARELSTVNNRTLVSINGVRDRLRVLLVSGQPHPGERTWRNLLKSDPSVDLVHFTILRPPEKDDFTPLNELALIAFPTHELFQERLEEFDLIVFDRYLVRGVLRDVYLGNIARYVRSGGALLMAVGPEFSGRRSLYHTPLRDVLPVAPTGSVLEEGFRPDVSETGARHPVTAPLARMREALKQDTRIREKDWGRWFRQVGGRTVGGVPVMNGLSGQPLLLLERVGKGRVAQLMSDHIWLWARGYEGGGPQGELLRRMAHWLMREPDLEEESLSAHVKAGKLIVERQSLEEAADTTLKLTSPSGETRELTLEAAEPGLSRAETQADEIGLYRVSDGTRTALVAAGDLNPLELSDLRATPEALQPLSTSTGGAVRWLDAGVPDVRRVAVGRDTEGRDWIGLVSNNAFVVTGLSEVPLLPGLLFVLAALAAVMGAWWREGR